jgi:hypothetical protein
VSIAARPSCLCVPFSKKLDILHDRLDDRHMMHDSRMAHSSWHVGTRSTPITVAVRRFTGHKYLLRLALITISHFFFHSRLGFTFLTLRLQAMEDKRDTKRTCSPSKEGSPSPSSAPTPPLAPSRSPPPLGSPPEVSSRRPHSPVFEQGSSSRKAPIVDLSSSLDEEGLIPDTSRDEEFTKNLSGDLNRDVLGSLGDSKIIILSNSNEEEEVCEEDATDAEVVNRIHHRCR